MERSGRAFAFAAAVTFALNGSISKMALESGMPADRLTALRNAGAAICMLAIVGVTRPRTLRVRRAELPVLLACGVIGVALVQWLYFVAIGRLPVGIGLLLEFTAPVWVAVWTRFGFPVRRRRPVHARVWGALALVLGGLAVLARAWEGMVLDPVGLAAGLAAAFALAAFYLLGERAMEGRDGPSFAALIFLVGAVFWAVVRPWWTFPVDALTVTSEPGIPVWVLCIGVVLIGTVIPYLFEFAALKRLAATRVAIIGMSEPVIAGFVAWLVLGEVLDAYQLAGGAIVLLGIALAQSSSRDAAAVLVDAPAG